MWLPERAACGRVTPGTGGAGGALPARTPAQVPGGRVAARGRASRRPRRTTRRRWPGPPFTAPVARLAAVTSCRSFMPSARPDRGSRNGYQPSASSPATRTASGPSAARCTGMSGLGWTANRSGRCPPARKGVIRSPASRARTGERARRQREAQGEDHQALDLLQAGPGRSAHPEGQPAVRGGVGHGGEQQREEVRRKRPERRAQQQEQPEVGERAHKADRGEPDELPRHSAGHAGDVGVGVERGAPELAAELLLAQCGSSAGARRRSSCAGRRCRARRRWTGRRSRSSTPGRGSAPSTAPAAGCA